MSLRSALNLASLLIRQRTPGQLVIQFTNHCNAGCPQCGMNVGGSVSRSRLDDDKVMAVIETAAKAGVKVVSFTGGEPLLFWKQLRRYIHAAGRAGIELIRTGTNGYVFADSHRAGFESRIKRLADEIAETPLRNFWISLDSAVPSVHEGMRALPGVVAGIEKALPIFHRRGIYPSANLGINRNLAGERDPLLYPGLSALGKDRRWAFYRRFVTSFERFYRFVIDLGFTMVNACYPMSLAKEGSLDDRSAVYAAASLDRLVTFTPDEKLIMFQALMEAISNYRSRIRIFSPLCSLHALVQQYRGETGRSRPCRGGIDYFFIDAVKGHYFPCGFRGAEDLGGHLDYPIPSRRDRRTECRLCDWECFRDPSELFGPLLDLFSNPWRLLKKWGGDREALAYWLADLRYYRACDLFHGRKPLNRAALSRFSPGEDKHRPVATLPSDLKETAKA